MDVIKRKYFVFVIHEKYFAIELDKVERVFMSQEITKVGKGPEYYEGVINIHGSVYPVLNFRKLCGLPEKDLDLNDKFILCDTGFLRCIIIADECLEIISLDDSELLKSADSAKAFEIVNIVSLKNYVVLIYDLQKIIDQKDILSITQIVESIQKGSDVASN